MKTKFGFDIQDNRQIDLDQEDTRLAEEVAAVVKSWKACMKCGACVGTCPVGKGVLSLSGLSTCLMCGKCLLVCPRGINTRHLILEVMNKYREYGKAV
jgi:Fe-S oxidoreductase